VTSTALSCYQFVLDVSMSIAVVVKQTRHKTHDICRGPITLNTWIFIRRWSIDTILAFWRWINYKI